jgi:hypothetical protein
MLHGDLSNKVSPKLLVVFEGAVGVLPKDRLKDYSKFTGKKKYKEAADCYRLTDSYLDQVLYLNWKKNYNISLVTYLGQDMAWEIERIMDARSIPVGECYSYTPVELARRLVHRPDVIAVYDPDPQHILTYGSKAVLLTEAKQIGR